MTDRARFERYRLMVISTWPESALKRVALASAQTALDREMEFAQLLPRDEPFVTRRALA
jgi:hypothetical protein